MRNIEPSNNAFIFTSRSTGTANSTQQSNYQFEKVTRLTVCTDDGNKTQTRSPAVADIADRTFRLFRHFC